MSGQPAEAASRAEGARSLIRRDLGELVRLSGPLVFSRLGIMTMGLTDAIVVGRFSAVQLGYHALGWAVASVIVATSIGLLSGVQVMASRAMGEGEPAEAGAALRRGLVYAIYLGAGSTALLVAGGPGFLHSINLPADLADGASKPLIIFSLSMIPLSVSVAATSWLEGLGRPLPAMLMMWLANVVNLVVVILLAPGTFGLPAMGAVGAGWATFGARSVLALGTLAYIATLKDARALGVFSRAPHDRPRELAQRRIGYGAGASSFFEVAAFAAMNVVAGWLGSLAVAAWAVTLNVVAIVFMIPLGLATAAAVLVGKAYGARDEPGMDRAALLAYGVTAVFGAVAGLVVWPGAGLIASAYTADAQTIALATPALVLSALFLIPDALQVVVAQTLRARGDVLMPTITHLASYMVLMIPLSWFLAIRLHLGLNGIVWAVIIASFVSAGLLLLRFWALARRGV